MTSDILFGSASSWLWLIASWSAMSIKSACTFRGLSPCLPVTVTWSKLLQSFLEQMLVHLCRPLTVCSLYFLVLSSFSSSSTLTSFLFVDSSILGSMTYRIRSCFDTSFLIVLLHLPQSSQAFGNLLSLSSLSPCLFSASSLPHNHFFPVAPTLSPFAVRDSPSSGGDGTCVSHILILFLLFELVLGVVDFLQATLRVSSF